MIEEKEAKKLSQQNKRQNEEAASFNVLVHILIPATSHYSFRNVCLSFKMKQQSYLVINAHNR